LGLNTCGYPAVRFLIPAESQWCWNS